MSMGKPRSEWDNGWIKFWKIEIGAKFSMFPDYPELEKLSLSKAKVMETGLIITLNPNMYLFIKKP